ncbi:MAG: hypothetical protein KKC75_06120 [Nanoarchaeota archaeon]|nr:hypothetical protein [Nanoarchaeota archaeon]MBU1004718.1 hypothetical protein [Nanoarchaeota archaeon]MBU1945764.1 hypothetical protein [Nanoarchaeota archaeon]
MATDDSYEIMPYKEIVELKKQIGDLQKKTGDTSSKELLGSMAALTKSMNGMLQLFSSAAEEMKLEEKSESELSRQIGPLMEQVANLEQQNKTIAEGLVAVADMVKDIKKESGKIERDIKPKAPSKTRPLFGNPPLMEKHEDNSSSDNESSMDMPELPPLEPPEDDGNDLGLPPLEPPEPMNPQPPHQSPRVVLRRPMNGPGGPGPMPQFGQMPPPRGPPGMMPPRGPRGMMPPPGPMPPGQFDLGPLPPLPPLDDEPKKKGFSLFKKK